MSLELLGLLTTLSLGIFILIGAVIALLFDEKKTITELSIGLAFGVIIALIVTDLLPEIMENLRLTNIYIFIIGTIIGFGILKLLDNFIPDHEDHHLHNKKDIEENLIHIGIMTSLALVLHNIIEGMAVYSTVLTSNTSLLIGISLGVGFHNLPLGMVISSSLYQSNKSKKKTIISLLFVSISTFLGGLLLYIFKITSINEIILGTLLSITLGMLLYIVVDELYPKIKDTKDKKIVITGIVIGIILLLISMIF